MPSPAIMAGAIAIADAFMPQLIGRLTGPRRDAIARTVVATARAVAGTTEAPAAALETIRSDPAKSTAMRIELAALEAEEYRAEVTDRISARETWDEHGSKVGVGMVIGAFALLLLTIGAVIYVETEGVDAPQGMTLLVTVGAMATAMLKDAFSFWYGSSRGSKEKSDTLRRVQDDMMAHRPPETPQEPREPLPAPPPMPAPELPATDEPMQRRPASRDFIAELRA